MKIHLHLGQKVSVVFPQIQEEEGGGGEHFSLISFNSSQNNTLISDRNENFNIGANIVRSTQCKKIERDRERVYGKDR